jgi:MFS transporter, OFA family, oxalate/formate antiporter
MADAASTAVPTGGRFRTLLVLCLGLFLFAYTVPLMGIAKAQLTTSLGLKTTAESWPLLMSFFLSWFIIVPPGAWLADVIGRKPLLILGSLLLVLGMLGLSYADTMLLGCIGQFLIGAGGILLQIIGIAAVTDLFANKRGNVLNIAVGLVGIFGLLSPVLFAALVPEQMTWNAFYRYSAVLPGLLIIFQLVSSFPETHKKTPVDAGTIKRLLTDPVFLLLIFAMYVYGVVEQGIPSWASSYVGEELGGNEQMQGWLVSGFWNSASIVRLLVGLFGWGERISYSRQVIFSSIAAIVCVVLATVSHNATMATTFFALSGAAIALIWPSIMTYAAQYSKAPATTVFGLIVGIGGALGVITGVSAPGIVKQRTELSYESLLLMLVVPFLMLMLVFFFRRSDDSAKS